MSGFMHTARRLRFAAALPLVLLAGLGPAREAGSILGRVTDLAGNPLAEATVEVEGTGGEALRWSTRSSETGGFQVGGLPAGSYRVTAARSGYAPRTQPVALREGERSTVILRLRRARR